MAPSIKPEPATPRQDSKPPMETPWYKRSTKVPIRRPRKKTRISNKSPPSFPAQPRVKPPPRIPIWKSCASQDQLTQVQIKELAVQQGKRFLVEIRNTLNAHVEEDATCVRRIERIDAILGRKKEYRPLIGFIGVTGAGKSSLINALLQFPQLLPVDDGKACTAVVVEVSYNKSSDPEKLFQAVVERIGLEEWKAELESFYRDLKERDEETIDGEDEDEEESIERNVRIEAMFGKIRSVYPQFKDEEDIEKLKVDDLLHHANVRDILGKSVEVCSGQLKDFASRVAQYINSSRSKIKGGKSFSQWPLVKLVKLWVKSDILKDGLVLVDLPGCSDVNTARGAVADTYQQRLAVTCVVAPATRAASDKPAQDLLGKVTQRNMQLDDKFDGSHLCFIISMIDSSIQVERFIETHPRLEGRLMPLLEFESTIKSELLSLANKKAQLAVESKKLDKVFEKLPPKPTENLDPTKQKLSVVIQAGTKRKLDEAEDLNDNPEPTRTSRDSAGSSETYNSQRDDLLGKKFQHEEDSKTTEEKMKKCEESLWDLQSRKKRACVQSRNNFQTAAIKRDYQIAVKQMERSHKVKPLEVFPVTSQFFLEYVAASGCEGPVLHNEGFPSPEHTGIPRLQKWLESTSFEVRERNAENFLNEVEALLESLQIWLADGTGDVRLSLDQKPQLQSAFDSKISELDQKFKQRIEDVVNATENLINTEIRSKQQAIEKEAVHRLKQTIKIRGRLNWSTHKAVNRANGTWMNRKKVQHHWNEDMRLVYTDAILVAWVRVFHQEGQFQELRPAFENESKIFIEKISDELIKYATKECPSMVDALKQLRDAFCKNACTIENNALIAWEMFKDTAINAHRLILRPFSKSWEPVYIKCALEKGKGHFQRNKLTHQNHVGTNSLQMMEDCSKIIDTVLQKAVSTFQTKLSFGYIEYRAEICDDFRAMLAKYSSNNYRSIDRKSKSVSKQHIQEELSHHFTWLREEWAKDSRADETSQNMFKAYTVDHDDVWGLDDTEPKVKDGDWNEGSGSDSSDDDDFMM